MDTKQLVTFVTFAKEKSFTKSSMKLNYAVSTLSEHISSLEAELGTQLVERHGKRTALTQNGEIFLEYANKLLSLWQETQDAMAFQNTVHGPLRVLASESLGLYRAAPVLAKFSKAFPNVELSVSISNPNSFFEKLETEETDVVFCFGLSPYDGNAFQAATIFKEDLLFVAYPKHSLAKKEVVQPSDFRSEVFLLPHTDCFYRQALKDLLAENGVSLKTKMNLDSGSLIKNYIHAGYGISLLPRSVVQKELLSGELALLNWKGPVLTAFAQVITLKKKWQKPAVKELLRFTENMFQKEE